MRGLLLSKPGEFSIIERQVPKVNSGEVLVKIAYAGICGSDIHGYEGTNPFMVYPRILGHEVSGTIAEDPMGQWSAGTKVVVDPVVACGKCYACRVGRHNVCRDLEVFGVHRDGGYQEIVAVPRQNIALVPTDMDLSVAALAEPISIGFQAAYRSRLNADDFLLILGAGTIGLMVAAVAKSMGARVAITDISDYRLGMAKQVGADHTLNVAEQPDVDTFVKDLTGGEGPSVVIEAVGLPKTIEQSVELVAPAGRVVVLGLVKEVKISMQQLFKKEVDLLGSRLNTNMFPQAVKLLSEQTSTLRPFISKIYPYTEADEAFRDRIAEPEKNIKTLLAF